MHVGRDDSTGRRPTRPNSHDVFVVLSDTLRVNPPLAQMTLYEFVWVLSTVDTLFCTVYLQLSSFFPFVFRRVFRCRLTFSSAVSHAVSSGGGCTLNICGQLSQQAPLAAWLVSCSVHLFVRVSSMISHRSSRS